MSTYRELQDRICLDYLNRTDLYAETKRAITRAIKFYERERFWFNGTATAIAVGTASFSVAAIPSDFLALDYVTVRDASLDSMVAIRSWDRIGYQAGRTDASGVPTEICEHNQQLVMNFKPASATTITVHYTMQYPALSADGDTNPWTDAGEELIVHRAAADMWANVLRVADPAVVQSHKQMEGESLDNLRMQSVMRQRSKEGGMNG